MTSLILQDGTVFEGESFGAPRDSDGEVVFTTGMVGYPESLTDPSYRGQILVFTYPLIGNYGVPSEEKNEYGFSRNFESEHIHVRGVVVAQESRFFSHHNAVSSLHNWMVKHDIPGITGVDTRALTKKLREHGVMLGCLRQNVECRMQNVELEDPNKRNLVAEVSCKEVTIYEPRKEDQVINPRTVLAYDCGMKRGILRNFLKRGITVIRVPWDFNLESCKDRFDGVFISNGPGDPKICIATIENIRRALEKGIPTFGICLGCQLMALAIGGETYKLKYGHRGANQPCIERVMVSSTNHDMSHCIITSQNHGFAVDEKKLPLGWSVWFTNANDGTVEGIRHQSGKFFAVQFHPEASPGPEDANYLFDEFLAVMRREK
ncbi:glutamine-hydrolyzing carbamoyl-phosphate synthase small subunit [Candidatus Peregrinibacteria bacterium]|nr:glutamine-hydrolyzing carbamoyl-phosphate synthase small subunit [Candidatus Peregrinibacteria bacterium]